MGGSQSIMSAEGLIGADPRKVQAKDGVEQLAQAAGQGAASAVLPMGPARALMDAPGAIGAAAETLGGGSVAGQAALGGASAAAGQVAADNASPEWAPVADMAAQLGVGGLAAGAVAGARAAGGATASLARGAVQPFTQAGRETMAANRIASSASDLPAVKEALARNNAPVTSLDASGRPSFDANGDPVTAPAGEIVPGSAPTTFQATLDPGLGQLERAAQRNPAVAPKFASRMDQQNAARVAAIDAIAPDGSPQAIGTAFRGMLDDLTARSDEQVAAARGQAQEAAANLGGNTPPGPPGSASALQAFGSRLRTPAAAASQAAKAAEGEFWNAIDPGKDLTVNMIPVRSTANEIMSGMARTAQPPQGEEAAIIRTAQMLPGIQPFSELTAFRSRITDALRTARMDPGGGRTVARLSQLLDGVHDTMQASIAQRVALDQHAVTTGLLDPTQSLATRLAAEQRDWYASRDDRAATAFGRGVGGDGAPDLGADAGGGPRSFPGAPRAEGAPIGGRGDAPGNPGLPSTQGLGPTFDAAAGDRYAAARAATADRAATFKTAPGVGSILRSGPTSGSFAMPDSAVPGALFRPGPGAAERVQAYARAGGDMQALHDYAAFDLKQAAEREDGTLDPAKTERWADAHDEALSAFPGARERFTAAGEATRAVEQAQQNAVLAKKAFQRSALARFTGDADPVRVVGQILRGNDALPRMSELARATEGHPDAREGLQRAVIEHILSDIRSNKPAGQTGTDYLKTDAFQTFVRRTPEALGKIFSANQVKAIREVAADLQRANRSISGTQIPGRSNTAHDLRAGAAHGHGDSGAAGTILTSILAEHAGEAAEHLAGGVIGHLVLPGALIWRHMRAAGMSKVDDLVSEAMLHPRLAEKLLVRATPGNVRLVMPGLIRSLQGLAVRAPFVRPESSNQATS